MFEKLVDIIIPVYNKSIFLNDLCVRLQKLPSSSYNIIFIDDGSTDDSALIINHLTKDLKNFYLFQKKNGGVSSARNYGINKSISKYIWFVDPDDLIDEDLREINDNFIFEIDADVIIFNYTLHNIRDSAHIKFNFKERGFYENIYFSEKYDALKSKEKNMNIIWNKWYKRKFIENIEFNENIHLGEDRLFNIEVFFKRGKTFFLNKKIYDYYLYESDTLSTSLTLKKINYIYQVNHINLKVMNFDRVLCKNHIIEQIKIKAKLNDKKLIQFYIMEHRILKKKILPFLNFNEIIIVFFISINLYFVLLYVVNLFKKR